MKKLKKPLALFLAVLMTAALAGCGGGSNDNSSSVIIGQSSEVANLNPMIQPRTPDSNVQCLIFDYLVIPDENLNYVGDLAKDWDISDSIFRRA